MRIEIRYLKRGDEVDSWNVTSLEYPGDEIEQRLRALPEEEQATALVDWVAEQPEVRVLRLHSDLPDAETRTHALRLKPAAVLLEGGQQGSWLSELPTLEELGVDDVTAFDWKVYPKLKHLRALAVSARCCPFDLDFLADTPLERLELRGLEGVKLPALPMLTALSLGNVSLEKAALAGAPALRELTLDDVKVDEVPAPPTLESLTIKYHRQELSLEPLRKATQLAHVKANLHGVTSGAVDLSPLGGAATLTSLDLQGQEATGLKKLAPLGALTRLSLNFSTVDAPVDLSRAARLEDATFWSATGLEGAVALRSAHVIGEPDLAELAALALCPTLERVEFNALPKGLSLDALASLPKLATLSLGYDCRPTAKQLAKLASKTGLQVECKLGCLAVDELVGRLTGKIKVKQQRDFALPTRSIKAEKGDPGPAGFHSCGTPALKPDEAWPECGHCHKPMPCLLQVALGEPWKGLLQFFYCTGTEPHCEVETKTWQGVGPAMLLRFIEAPPVKAPSPTMPEALRALKLKPKKLTVASAAKADVPDPTDSRESLGIEDAPKEPFAGDKLLGWPRWVQDPEWPQCPECSRQMTLLAQLNSNKIVAHQWGDLGVAYLFACPDHHDQLGFCWQCG